MPIVAPEETCYTFSMEKKGRIGRFEGEEVQYEGTF